MGVPLDTDRMEFVDNGVPELFADQLHDLELIGTMGLFTMVVVKKTAGGVFYKEPAFLCRLPIDAIAPAVALITRKMGVGLILPTIGAAVRSLMSH